MSISGIGSIPSAAQSAVTGIDNGIANLNQDAQSVAQSVSPSGDLGSLIAVLINSLEQKVGIDASASVLSTANQTLGSIIDVTA